LRPKTRKKDQTRFVIHTSERFHSFDLPFDAGGSMVVHEQPSTVDDSIATLLTHLYQAISFEEGDEPNWQGLTALFSEHARITRITHEGVDYLDPPRFLAMTRNLFEVGAYTSFYEFEVARHVQRAGDIAQVWSYYETRRNRLAQRPLSRGVNSIQLVCRGQTWRVLSLLWDEANGGASPAADGSTTRGGHHAET
jgi:hypothetical protein